MAEPTKRDKELAEKMDDVSRYYESCNKDASIYRIASMLADEREKMIERIKLEIETRGQNNQSSFEKGELSGFYIGIEILEADHE